MNYMIKRIIVGVCIALVMMMVHKVSHAAGFGYNGANGLVSTPQAWCDSMVGPGVTTYAATPVGDGYGICQYWTGSAIANVPKPVGTCDAPSTVTNGICNAPPATPKCTADGVNGDPLPGSHHDVMYAGNGKTAGWPGGAAGGKVNGCNIQIDQLDDDCKQVSGNWYCGVGYHYTGEGTYKDDSPGPTAPVPLVPNATPDQTNQPLKDASPNPDNSCPPGTKNIGTDSAGTAMCMGSGVGSSPTTQTTQTAPPVTTSNSDGSTTTTNTSTATNKDGSTTTTTNACTVNAGGLSSCTQSTSTSNSSAGAPGKSDGTGKGGGGAAGDDMCTKHPELNVCSNSQVVGNNCNGKVSNISVDGDAIQGAILKRMADEQCANAVDTPESILGKQMMAGQDPLAATLPTKANGQTVDVNKALDQTGFLGASCWADKSYGYGGKTLVIPFSTVCPYLIPLRVAVMFAALMAAYFMLSGAILRE